MILDYELELTASGGQAITATARAGGAAPGNYVDSKADADRGVGEPISAWAIVREAFNNLTSLDVQIVGGDAVDANGAPTWADEEVLVTKNFLLAALNTVSRFLAGIPSMTAGSSRRFYTLKFVVNGIAPTTGKISAGFTTAEDQKPANVAVTG